MSNKWKVVGWILTGLGGLVGLGSAIISKKENEAYIDKQIAAREQLYLEQHNNEHAEDPA